MKKSLLVAVAALFVAIGANAQIERHASGLQKVMKQAEAGIQMNKMEASSAAKVVTSTKANILKKASHRAGEVDGVYIMDYNNWDADFTGSTMFTITSTTGTINLDEDLYEEPMSFDYNVVLEDFTYEGAVAYGYFDAATGEIFIPVQSIFNETANSYGRFILTAATTPDAEGISYGLPITLEMTETGFEFAGETETGESLTGWYTFMIDYEKAPSGNYYAWNYGFDAEGFFPNAYMSTDVSGYLRTDGQTSGWQDERAEFLVCIEDLESELIVHNFLGMAPISVVVNGGGSVAIPLPQYVDDHDYSDDDGDYGCMRLVGADLEGTSLKRNYSKSSLPGTIKAVDGGYQVDFFDLDDEGHVIQDADHVPYLAVATANDSQGRAYAKGYMFAIRLEIPTSDPSGINEVNTVNKTTTAKTYNMMGQEVNAAAKGLLIRDGRKYIAK